MQDGQHQSTGKANQNIEYILGKKSINNIRTETIQHQEAKYL